MTRAIVRRLYQSVLVMFVVATATFFLIHLAPGDPFTPSIESANFSQEIVAQQRRNFGLDQPAHIQYVRYLQQIATGNFGISFSQHRPVLDVFYDVIPNTIVLAIAAILIDFVTGMTVGVFQSTRKGSRVDSLLSAISLVLYSTPVFWFGLMLVLLFGVTLRWLPTAGAIDPVVYHSLSLPGQLWDRIRHLILPAATLGLIGAGGTARFQRSALLEVLAEDFVRTARAKGLRERTVVTVHALRNSLLSIITLFGLSLPALLSGAVLVETVFSWPGMGRLITDAVSSRDYPVITGAAIVSALLVVAGNLTADILYRFADPRTRTAQ